MLKPGRAQTCSGARATLAQVYQIIPAVITREILGKNRQDSEVEYVLNKQMID
jgi:hypothetical protein